MVGYWKPNPKRRTGVIPIFCPYQPMVRLDNGARDGQSHDHAFRLAGEKRFEDLFQFVFGENVVKGGLNAAPRVILRLYWHTYIMPSPPFTDVPGTQTMPLRLA
jgi:hypothetical protein